MEKRKIITYGLTAEQNEYTASCLPNRNFEILVSETPTDLIAIDCAAAIINGCALAEESAELLFGYFREINGCTDETLVWIGEPYPPKDLRKMFRCYSSFETIREKLKYLLLSAYAKSRKATEYSTKLLIGLKILSLIRNHPGITTKELADQVSIPVRTTQRTIAALQAAGEWIEYDRTLRGWKLFHGVSVLFGDIWDGRTEE